MQSPIEPNKLAVVLLSAALTVALGLRLRADDPPSSIDESLQQKLHRLAESAESAKDFTVLIDECQKGLAGSLDGSDQKYLKSLAAWALNRRCEKRIDLAFDFEIAGNKRQALIVRDEALADAIESIALDDTRWRAFLNRGVLFAGAGLSEQALADFQTVCRLQPNEPCGWFNCAEIQSVLRNDADAVACYDRAVELDSADVQALTGRGLARCRLGELENALKDFEVVARLRATDSRALINRGDARVGLSQWKEAIDDYRQALQCESNGAALGRTAWLLATCPDSALRRPDEAIELANQSIAQFGETVENLESLAAAHAAKGEFDRAIEWQQRAVERDSVSDTTRRERLRLYQAKTPFELSTHHVDASAMRTSTTPDPAKIREN